MLQKIKTGLTRIKLELIIFKTWFDTLPTPIKILTYGLIAAILTLLDKNLTGLDITNPWAVLCVGYLHNILIWIIADRIPTGQVV